jgi:glycosyltransferase involved in cell wall biosynthesis
VIARRHAAALSQLGIEVCVAAPEAGHPSPASSFRVEHYEHARGAAPLFAPRRPDPVAVAALRAIIERFQPDVLYDVHGPAWGAEAAVASGVPVVSMIGDYNWFCRQSFLVDSSLRRCSGPETADKCFSCLNGNYSAPERVFQGAMKPMAKSGLIPLALWDAVQESRAYSQRLLATVGAFVVGDRHASEFLLGHGIPAHRIERIAQGLPREALELRRIPGDELGANRALRIGFVGRPHLDKGIHVLARAFDALPRELPAELWIAHAELATPEVLERHFPSAARFRKDLASGRIKLFRPAASEEVYQLMARMDVGVIPSLAYESPSLVMLEMAAQKTPVVRSESAGMEHVIQDGINGRTFPYGDWKALRDALAQIAAQPDLLQAWRARLPRIESDLDYARSLAHLFQSLVVPPRTTRQEAAHA